MLCIETLSGIHIGFFVIYSVCCWSLFFFDTVTSVYYNHSCFIFVGVFSFIHFGKTTVSTCQIYIFNSSFKTLQFVVRNWIELKCNSRCTAHIWPLGGSLLRVSQCPRAACMHRIYCKCAWADLESVGVKTWAGCLSEENELWQKQNSVQCRGGGTIWNKTLSE